MKATGIVRRIDDLGRVVIPKEIRKNNKLFMIFRVAVILFSIFAPIIVDSLMGRS